MGTPDDTPESIEANLAFARRWVDYPYIQHPTPYPRTPMTGDLRERGLIINERLEEYDGTTAVVRSEHLEAEEIEFLRWRAERWMKVHHMGAVLRHSPGFVLRNWRRMLAHTFRGGSFWQSLVVAGGARGRAAGLCPLPGHPEGRTCLCVRVSPPAHRRLIRAGARPAQASSSTHGAGADSLSEVSSTCLAARSGSRVKWGRAQPSRPRCR